MPSHKTNAAAADPQAKSSKNQLLVSTMIKQGFLSDPLLSPTPSPPSAHHLPFSLCRPTTAAANATSVSPPPSFTAASTNPPRSSPSPTLFEMMSEEQARDSKQSIEARLKLQDRVFKVLADAPFQGNDASHLGPSDVRLTVSACDGFSVSMEVHRRVLACRSRFFDDKLLRNGAQVVTVEILECDNVEVYVEAVVFMYCEDLKKRLMGEEVTKVLELLKVCSAISFDEGVLACLEYLEAVPWSEEEEKKVVSQLGDLHLHEPFPNVLQRVVAEASTSSTCRADDIFLKLLTGVLQAKDDKARREMKALISRLLKQESADNRGYGGGFDVSKDMMSHVCHRCLSSLVLSLSEATCVDENRQDRGVLMGEIARAADNLQWVVDILVDRKMGDEFVRLWAEQKELAVLHSKIPTMYRHEISRITAQLCVAIGRGQILVAKDARYSLLATWLEALYEDFGWMKRASRSMDKKVIEDGLSQTISTLPLPQQQAILLSWFERFLNRGDDCPNIQRAFEVWWRRSFVKQYAADSDSQLQITTSDYSTTS